MFGSTDRNSTLRCGRTERGPQYCLAPLMFGSTDPNSTLRCGHTEHGLTPFLAQLSLDLGVGVLSMGLLRPAPTKFGSLDPNSFRKWGRP